MELLSAVFMLFHLINKPTMKSNLDSSFTFLLFSIGILVRTLTTTVCDFLSDSGSLFHNFGAALLKALPPVLTSLVDGIVSFLLSNLEPLLKSDRRQFMYGGLFPCNALYVMSKILN